MMCLMKYNASQNNDKKYSRKNVQKRKKYEFLGGMF